MKIIVCPRCDNAFDYEEWISVKDEMPRPLTKVALLFETEATRFGEYVPSMERFEPISSNEKQWTLQPTHWKSLEPLEESW